MKALFPHAATTRDLTLVNDTVEGFIAAWEQGGFTPANRSRLKGNRRGMGR